jgi:NAD(P)-dependent dehydrogenase (short-subunit alcohol dehydrogenase family)
MAWTTADIPDLTGRVAVVTGANTGLGYQTTRALAGAGAEVVMAVRNLAKAGTARSKVLAEHPEAPLQIQEIDLASLASVAGAAGELIERYPTIDILVNNAGVMAIPQRETDDGFEMQFGVNHLGHFALTAQLWPALIAGDGARIVAITSFGRHYRGRFDPTDPPLVGEYNRWKAYGQSKMANLRFCLELDRRANTAGLPIAGVVAHPGLAHTNLLGERTRYEPRGLRRRLASRWVERFGMESSRGALSQIRAATDPSAGSDRLYAPRFVVNGAPIRRPLLPRTRHNSEIDLLWEVSERMTGIRFEI